MSNRFEASNLTKHLLSPKRASSYKGLSSYEIYLLKKKSLDERSKTLAKTQEADLFFDWFFGIQKKYGWTDEEFAKRLGWKSRRSLYKYRNRDGTFPSLRTIEQAKFWDRISRIQVNIITNFMTLT